MNSRSDSLSMSSEPQAGQDNDEIMSEDEPSPTESCPSASTLPCLRKGKNTDLILRSIFFLLGIGVLVPWNAFISAKAYFESRLCDDHGQSINKNVESTFAIVYNCSSVLFLACLILGQWFFDQKQAEREANRNQQPSSPIVNSKNHQEVVDTQSSSGRSSSSASTTAAHSFWMVIVPLSLFFLVFLSQAVAVLWVQLNPQLFYTWTLTSLALCGICGALANSGIIATAGLFLPEIAMEPFLAGQAAGGLGVSVANMMAAVAEDPNDFWDAHCMNDSDENSSSNNITTLSATERLLAINQADSSPSCTAYNRVDHAVLSYFTLGSIVLAACVAGYMYIDRFQKQQHRDEYETIRDAENVEDPGTVPDSLSGSPLGVEMNDSIFDRRGSNDDENHDPLGSQNNSLEVSSDHVHRGIVDTATSFGHDDVLDSHHESENEMAEVLNIVKSPAFCIFMVFVVTLSLFPSWISQLRSTHQCNNIRNRLANDLYTPLAFVVFNAGDLIGRLCSGYVPLAAIHHVSAKLVTGSILRFGLYPMLFFCASQNASGWTVDSELYSWSTQILFAVSHGFLTSSAFVHAPSLLPNVSHVQERSAEILTFSLYLGLLMGSICSVPVTSIFQR